MGGTLGEVPLRGNGFGRPCVPGPHPEVPAAVGLGTVGLKVLEGSGRSFAQIPTPTRGWPWGLSGSKAGELSEATRELDRKGLPSCPQKAGLTS